MSNQPTALVTGGSRGIGRGICLELARAGFAVVVNYVSRSDAAEETVKQIESLGSEAVAVRASVADRADHRLLLDAVYERFGRLDLLVNNAGITSQGRKDLLDATEESWDLVFATNLKGPFFLTQAVARRMIEQIDLQTIPDGKIVNISSLSAYTASTNRADYCMSKAAISMMTQLFAHRLAENKIGVYEVSPGVIASDMTAPVQEKYDRLIAEGLWPIRRWGTPEDVGRAVAAIARDYFPFTTGQRFDVDGGFHIRHL